MFTAAQIAEKINARLEGDGSIDIKSVVPVEAAGENDITFVTDDRRLAALAKSGAAAAIVNKPVGDFRGVRLIVKDVNAALIETLKLFAPKLTPPAAGIHPTAVIGRNVEIAGSASVGPNVTVADNVRIDDNCVLAAGVRVGENSTIGRDSRLDSNVVIYHNCRIGRSVIIQANTTIGSTGFGYAQVDGRAVLIPHIGGVIIEDFVEIGANCCIDRAKFDNTIIGAGTKIDNLVGQAGIAGSGRLGDGVILAGQAGLVDNVSIGDGAVVGAQAGVVHNVSAGKKVVGSPAIDYAEKFRQIAQVKRLGKMTEQLKELTKRVNALEASADDKK
jgi:UDP-3-O-[3-hydroxymyristoyl] glucosamine N-acyltransferase